MMATMREIVAAVAEGFYRRELTNEACEEMAGLLTFELDLRCQVSPGVSAWPYPFAAVALADGSTEIVAFRHGANEPRPAPVPDVFVVHEQVPYRFMPGNPATCLESRGDWLVSGRSYPVAEAYRRSFAVRDEHGNNFWMSQDTPSFSTGAAA